MATGNMLLGLSRKKLGDIIFYRSEGQQRARVRVRTIKNPRSAKQAVQRMVLATASKTLAALRGLYNHSFENIAVGNASTRHAQKLLMEGYRNSAALAINEGTNVGNAAQMAIKGAPIAGCFEGQPMSRGRLSMNLYSLDADGRAVINVSDATALAATITTQAQYAAALAAIGLEPGDQLTLIVYAGNTDVQVATFGDTYNYADAYRYARVTFVPTLPEGFSGTLLSETAINPALIATSEGVLPSFSLDNANTAFVLDAQGLPSGYSVQACAVVRSQKNAGGTTYYSNADFVTNSDVWDDNTAAYVYGSYMDGAEGIDVGDTLYLKNAEAAPTSYAGAPASPFDFSVSFPIVTQTGNPFTIRKLNGQPWTDAEIEALVFTIDGESISATSGSSISWQIGGTQVLNVARTTYTDTISVEILRDGYTITAVA